MPLTHPLENIFSVAAWPGSSCSDAVASCDRHLFEQSMCQQRRAWGPSAILCGGTCFSLCILVTRETLQHTSKCIAHLKDHNKKRFQRVAAVSVMHLAAVPCHPPCHRPVNSMPVKVPPAGMTRGSTSRRDPSVKYCIKMLMEGIAYP